MIEPGRTIEELVVGRRFECPNCGAPVAFQRFTGYGPNVELCDYCDSIVCINQHIGGDSGQPYTGLWTAWAYPFSNPALGRVRLVGEMV